MCVLNIEPAGFQTFGHRFYGPPFLVIREGFLRAADGNEDLRFRLSGLVLDSGTCQIAEFSTDTVDAVQDTFFSVFEVCKDMLGPYLSTCSGIFHPEVVSDADVVLDSVVVKPFEPFVTDELTVCNQTFDAVTSEPLHDVDSLLEVGVPAFLQESEQDGERHMIIRYAQYQHIDIHISELPVRAVHRESVWSVEWDTKLQISGHGIKVQYHLCQEALEAPEA